ncbi:MAG: hypothetical protein E7487_06360 [Ruminococcaceae bacterium]|nr:hypothetical protein [Oscillospiraceae bacterium]
MTNVQALAPVILENEQFCLRLRGDCVAESLIHKPTGIECLMQGEEISLFSLTEERPYNNEIKLAHPNKRTTFQANRVRMEGDKLIVGFELVTFEAMVEVKITPNYIAFKLEDFIVKPEDFNDLAMTPPPVYEFRVLQLPVKKLERFGEWLNVMWDDKVAINVLGTSPWPRIDSEKRKDFRILYAENMRDVKLKNCGAALIVSSPDKLMDNIEAVEIDYDLPRGVASRRSGELNSSIYWSATVTPQNVDEHIDFAKRGGFTKMLLYYTCMIKEHPGYFLCGNYTDFRAEYPNGYEDLRKMLQKIRDAGITPGIHFLQTHIGFESKYVTPVADHRLNLTRHFTLAKALGTDDTTIYVEQNPEGAVVDPRCRILKFGGELIGYESYTTEWPYCFTGCVRGFKNTNIVPHEIDTIGGILDVSEFGATSVYLDQRTSLQDEIAEMLAKLYDCGFGFIYFDGSEGAQPPFEIYVPLAQYRVYRQLGSAPLFCEGAAKAHFSWHMLSGGNAFDVFPTDIFKKMIARFPAEEAPRMANDFTRLNFGWWAYFEDTRPDVYEYGTSRAAAWDCPVTMQGYTDSLRKNPRTDDTLEVMRRWEDVRAKGLLTAEMKEQLKNTDQEHIMLINEDGEYEMRPYDCIVNAVGGDKRVTAFIFERNNKNYVVCWDNTGNGKLSLPIAASDLTYEGELGGEQIAVEVNGNAVIIPIEGRRYLSTSLAREELIKAFEAAVIVE